MAFFDFIKKTWRRGEFITKEDLNRMEDGIYAASQGAQDGSITTAMLAAGAVTNAKLANGAVTTPKIADGAVTNPKLADGAVAYRNLADGAVATTKLADGAVSYAKLNTALKGKVDAFDALGLSVVDGMLCVTTYSE